MPSTDEEDYGDIADEDLIGALSPPSQILPPRPRQWTRNDSDEIDDEEVSIRRPNFRYGMGEDLQNGDEGNGRAKGKKKLRIHETTRPVPPPIFIGATQGEQYNSDSDENIRRGPIYMKSRPEPSKPPSNIRNTNTPRYKAPPGNPPQESSFARTDSTLSHADVVANELDNIPDDFFSSEEDIARNVVVIGSSSSRPSGSAVGNRLVAPLTGLHQTTLWGVNGGRAPTEAPASQARKVRNFRVDLPAEAPTHHVLNTEALSTWIYPKNLGAVRDYQYSIVKNALFNNTLVALPTGLGKTFIAATVMYNFFRWTKDAQIVFVAPTKPLVAQQVGACFGIVGLPRSATTMLTGEQQPALRAEEWGRKRVFFMTPQTLMNDLSHGYADPKKIVLLIVDEAHRATGDYAYNKVVQFLRRFNKSFRILALTATPGATVEAVQEVIDGLEISEVEIRTEESIDIQPYTHTRNMTKIIIDPSDEISMIKELLTKALQPLANKLAAHSAYWNKDPMSYTQFGLLTAKNNWLKSDAGRRANQGLKGMIQAMFTVLLSVSHSLKLLNYHGIGPFYESMKEFRESTEDGKGGKYKKEIVHHADFKLLMDRISGWINKSDFVGHPKLPHLCDTILNHFLDAGDGRMGEDMPPSSTRVIVFSEYRDSAEDIVRILNRHGPLIRASVFVGQQDSKRSAGMNQGKQQDTIKKFKSGTFNVIVATSIGEEGLDIGSVDLIVCYDASGSPIRMLQRMGRTGRKRAGNIVLLLMRGKEEENFAKAKDNYEKMQQMIACGANFNFRHDLSVRIIPRGTNPEVEHKLIDIPPENSQDTSLPEPKRGRAASKPKKKPAKKFHMPDGVEIGFKKASKVGEDGTIIMSDSGPDAQPSPPRKVPESQLAPIPDISSVLLTPKEQKELEKNYQNVAGADFQEVEMPSLTAQPLAQRSLLRTATVGHGSLTRRCVELFKTLSRYQIAKEQYMTPYDEEPNMASWNVDVPDFAKDDTYISKAAKSRKAAVGTPIPTSLKSKPAPIRKKAASPKPKPTIAKRKVPPKTFKSPAQHRARAILDEMSDDEAETPPRPKKRQKVAFPRPNFLMSMEEDDFEEGTQGPPSSEGEGDDLMHSEAISADISDGESLVDFVVGDDAFTSSREIPSSPPTGPYSSSPPLVRTKSNLGLFVATQESVNDFEIPDLQELGRKSEKSVLTSDDDEDDDDKPTTRERRKQRRMVLDSDSDSNSDD